LRAAPPFDFRTARIASLQGGKSVAQQYFEYLCLNDAAEVIVRRVTGVEGFAFLRPRGPKEDTKEDRDRFGPEEPTGFGWFNDDDEFNERFDSLGDSFVQPLYGVYLFVEYATPGRGGEVTRVVRASEPQRNYPHGISANWRSPTSGALRVPYLVKRERANSFRARYAYTWRGLHRPRDREFGIAGGEFFLIDRVTNEVLAVKRTFNSTFVPSAPSYTKWSAARECGGLARATPLPRFAIQALVPDIQVNDAFLPQGEEANYHAHLSALIEGTHAK
jgi:hypothetical protein